MQKDNIKQQINSSTIIAGSFNITLSSYTFFQQPMELLKMYHILKCKAVSKMQEKNGSGILYSIEHSRTN